LIAAGLPVRRDGLIDRGVAAKWVAEHVRPRVKPGAAVRAPGIEVTQTSGGAAVESDDAAAGIAGDDYWKSRTRHETAKANKAELDLAVQEGKLLDAEEVAACWAAIGTAVRDEVMSIPSRVVIRLPEEWRHLASVIVSEETKRALSEISHKFSEPSGVTTHAH
jgi:hypothetical protein